MAFAFHLSYATHSNLKSPVKLQREMRLVPILQEPKLVVQS